MGSGSDNHFRLDLPASVAKLIEDGLLLLRVDRRKEKNTVKNGQCGVQDVE